MSDRSVEKVKLTDICQDAYIILITGAKRSGKTALGFLILEKFHNIKRPVCILPYKKIPPALLPDWIQQDNPLDPKLEKGTIYFLDDWHLVFHAREWYRREHIDANKVMSIARHLDMKFIINTQVTTQIDISNVNDIDVHMMRRPAMNHEDAEREQVKPRIKEATKFFNQAKEKGYDLKRCVYIVTEDQKIFLTDVPVPSFWTPELSTYMGGVRPS